MPHTYIPISVTWNLWFVPSNSETLGSATMIICPDKVTSIVPLQQPFHILKLFPACSGTSQYFHLPHHYEDHTIMMNISLDITNNNAINISTIDFRIWQQLAVVGPHHACRIGNCIWSSCHTAIQSYDWHRCTSSLIHNQGWWQRPIPDKDNLNESWDIHRDNWYGFCCMYRCLLL